METGEMDSLLFKDVPLYEPYQARSKENRNDWKRISGSPTGRYQHFGGSSNTRGSRERFALLRTSRENKKGLYFCLYHEATLLL